MKTVWKYPVPLDDRDHEIVLPGGGDIAYFAMQDGVPTVWAVCHPFGPDAQSKTTVRVARIFGTGHSVPDDYFWRGTAQDGPFVWHLFLRQMHEGE